MGRYLDMWSCEDCGDVITDRQRHDEIVHGDWTSTAPDPQEGQPVQACVDHKPKQHRDGKPPWCHLCGRTTDGSRPVSTLPNQQYTDRGPAPGVYRDPSTEETP